MGIFNINCNNGKMLCDKNQYKETSIWEKIKLNYYLVMCSECRAYTANNNKLTKAMNNSNIQTVSKDEKNALKERLAKELGQ